MNIGICGKSGSGKSTVSKFYREKGFNTIDLDQIGKDVINIYPQILEEISEVFGEEYIVNGALNRKKLGSLVFSSKKDLNKLNEIFFKYIKKETLKIISKFNNNLIEGAVLFQIGLNEDMNKNIYVKSSIGISINRLLIREKTDEKVLRDRISSQSEYDEYEKLCDIIIENNSSIESLYKKLESLEL